MGPIDIERIALIALLRSKSVNLTWPAISATVAEGGSALALWQSHAVADDLFGDASGQEELSAAEQVLRRWSQQQLHLITLLDDEYPAQLREIQEFPPLLFVRGHLVPGDRGVCLVGSRNASEQALRFTRDVARRLVQAGLSVLSGLASGVDTAAHSAALAEGGRTVAFLGTGIRKYYPAANRALQNEVATRGLLISQFLPDASPQKHAFLMRNAIMSGYGRATVVVEAGETSGTRAQARMAVEHGRPVILTDAVAQGTNWGAALATKPGVFTASSPDDVMEIVNDVTRPLQARLDSLTSTV